MPDEFEGRSEREHLDSRGLIHMWYRRPRQKHMVIQEREVETKI